MPKLSNDELYEVASNALGAYQRMNGTGVVQALKPLWAPTGDAGDAFMFAAFMIMIVINDLPKPVCSEHGDGCGHQIQIGLEAGDGGLRKIPDGFAEEHPAEVAYMRMLQSEFADDTEASMETWCAAVTGHYADEVLWIALQNAGNVARKRLGRLN